MTKEEKRKPRYPLQFTPAKAGASMTKKRKTEAWIPAFAGMTAKEVKSG